MPTVVRRTYDSTIQRATIWKGLYDEFQRRKGESRAFGRGRYLQAIYKTLRAHSDELRFDDGAAFTLNYEAVTESDLRDALARDPRPGARWRTDDSKLQVYHAFLQLALDGGFVAGEAATKYDDAATSLWDKLGYLADAWQAKGAELISGDFPTVWVGSIDLTEMSLNLGEDYECRFRMVDGEAFDGPGAKLQAFTRFTKFRTAFMSNAVIVFGDPLPGGMRPITACIYPLRGVLNDEAASKPFKDFIFQFSFEQKPVVQTPLSHGLYWFFERTEPLVFGGMAVPTLKGLGDRFAAHARPFVDFDAVAFMSGERRKIIGGDISGAHLLGSLDRIDQSVETSILLEMFGANNDKRMRTRMQLCGHPLPLVNNIFFTLRSSMVASRITSTSLNEERTGRSFPPPLVGAYDMTKLWEIYNLVEKQASTLGLELPSTDPRPDGCKGTSTKE